MNNYMRTANMIPELEDLQDEKSKLRALISNNFECRKDGLAKDWQALAAYVELKGYKHGVCLLFVINHIQTSKNYTIIIMDVQQ